MNNPDQQEPLDRYQWLILFGMRHVTPNAKNLSKLYQVVQGKGEITSAFFDRLITTGRKYTDLNPEKGKEIEFLVDTGATYSAINTCKGQFK